MKFLLQLFRNYRTINENKFSNINFDTKKYNAKMCTTYLKLYNINIPDKLPKKHEAVIKYK